MFSATHHGKGPWDGFGGIIKNRIIKVIIERGLHIDRIPPLVELCKELFDSEAVINRYKADKNIIVKKWFIDGVIASNPHLEWLFTQHTDISKGIEDVSEASGVAMTKLHFVEVVHRDGLISATAACYCAYCIVKKRPSLYGKVIGCHSQEDMKCCLMKRTDDAWVHEYGSRRRDLSADLWPRIKKNDLIAFSDENHSQIQLQGYCCGLVTSRDPKSCLVAPYKIQTNKLVPMTSARGVATRSITVSKEKIVYKIAESVNGQQAVNFSLPTDIEDLIHLKVFNGK
jgi:hypothetical protein